MAETSKKDVGLRWYKKMYYGGSSSKGKAYFKMGVRDTADREAKAYMERKYSDNPMSAEEEKNAFIACERMAFLDQKSDIYDLHKQPLYAVVIGGYISDEIRVNDVFKSEDADRYILGEFGEEIRQVLRENNHEAILELAIIAKMISRNIADHVDYFINYIENSDEHFDKSEIINNKRVFNNSKNTAVTYYNNIYKLLIKKSDETTATGNKTSSSPTQPAPKPADPREEKLHKLKDVEYYFKHGKELSDKEKREVIKKAAENMKIKAEQYQDKLKSGKAPAIAFIDSLFDTAETEMMLEDNPTAFSDSVYMLGRVLANEKRTNMFGTVRAMYSTAFDNALETNRDKGGFLAYIAISVVAAAVFAFMGFSPMVTAFFTGEGFKGAVGLIVVIAAIVVAVLCLGYGGLILCAIGSGAFLGIAYILTVVIEIGLVIKWIISIGAAGVAVFYLYKAVSGYTEYKGGRKKEKLKSVNDMACCREYASRCIEFIDKYETAVKTAVNGGTNNNISHLKDVLKMVPDVRNYYSNVQKDLDTLYERTR